MLRHNLSVQTAPPRDAPGYVIGQKSFRMVQTLADSLAKRYEKHGHTRSTARANELKQISGEWSPQEADFVLNYDPKSSYWFAVLQFSVDPIDIKLKCLPEMTDEYHGPDLLEAFYVSLALRRARNALKLYSQFPRVADTGIVVMDHYWGLWGKPRLTQNELMRTLERLHLALEHIKNKSDTDFERVLKFTLAFCFVQGRPYDGYSVLPYPLPDCSVERLADAIIELSKLNEWRTIKRNYLNPDTPAHDALADLRGMIRYSEIRRDEIHANLRRGD